MVRQYPHWWNTSLTIFNRIFDSSAKQTTWQKTTLHGCFYLQDSGLAYSDAQIRAACSYVVRIPEDSRYVAQSQWENMQNGRKGRFTLAPGDLIFKGEIREVLLGGSGNSLLEQYRPNCFKIQTVYDGSGYGVLGHYVAEGV